MKSLLAATILLSGCAGMTFTVVPPPSHCPGDIHIVQDGVHYTWDERNRRYAQDDLPPTPPPSMCGAVIKDKCIPIADKVVLALGKAISDILPNPEDFHSPDQAVISRPSTAKQLPAHWYSKVARFLHLVPGSAGVQVIPSFAGNLVSGETSLITSPMPLK